MPPGLPSSLLLLPHMLFPLPHDRSPLFLNLPSLDMPLLQLVFPLLRLIEVIWVGPWSNRISVLTRGDLRDLSPETRLASTAWAVVFCHGSLSRRLEMTGRLKQIAQPLRSLSAGFLHLCLPLRPSSPETTVRDLCVHLTRTEQLGQ